MLSSSYRLPKIEIPLLLRRGTHVRSENVELIYKKTTAAPRFAFIVSTKIDKRATERNRMRRTLSESVRHLLPTLSPMNGIFIAKKNFSGMKQQEVEKIVSALLRV